MDNITIDISSLYSDTGQAKLSCLEAYKKKCIEIAGTGNNVVLTGAGPVWLYLRLAHLLHGKVRSLSYDSPVTSVVEIFNHNPF